MTFGRLSGAVAVAVAGAALTIAGCGGGGGGGQLSKAAYAKKLTSIANDVKALRGLGGAGPPSAAQAEHIRSVLKNAASKISKLNPPSNVKADNKELATGLSQLADALGPLAKALKDKNASEAQSAMTKVQGASRKFQHAVNDLNKKGYNTG